MFSSKKSKYKKFLLKLLEKGQLEESDESKLNDYAKQLKLNEVECDKIRNSVLLQEMKPLLEHIIESKMFGFEQEKRLKAYGIKHRIELNFADEYQEYRKNWLDQKQNKENSVSSNQKVDKGPITQKSNIGRNDNLKRKSSPKFDNNMTVNQMVAAIENYKDLRTLENRSERLEEKYQDTYNRKYRTLSEKYEEAYKKGAQMIFKYQFIPNYEINTPLEILEQSYKIVDKKNELFKNIQDLDKYGYWEEFDGEILLQNESIRDIAEPKPDYWNGVIKFRKIVESSESNEEKKKAISKLAKSNTSFRENFISDDLEDLDDFINDFLKK